VELEAESTPSNRSWTPVVPVPSETVAVAMFQWKRVPISRKVILRHLAYALAIVLACAGLAYGASAAGSKSYGARTEIYFPLNAQLASGSFLREDRALSTQVVVMESHSILDPVAAQFHLSYAALSKKEVVSVLQNSEVIRIEIDDRSASQAKLIAGEIAKSYLKQVPNQDTAIAAYLNKQIASINNQLGTLTTQFNDLEAKRQGQASAVNPNPPETPAELSVQSEIGNLNGQVATLQGRVDAVTVDNLQQPHVQQQTQPYVLSSPVAPKPMRAALAGALAGIMLAAVALTLMFRRLLKRVPIDQLD
jgi:capsular polysaccharide biosynthesis protein